GLGRKGERRRDRAGPGQKERAIVWSWLGLGKNLPVKFLSPLLLITEHGTGQVLSHRQDVAWTGAETPVGLQPDGEAARARDAEHRIGKVPIRTGGQFALDAVRTKTSHGADGLAGADGPAERRLAHPGRQGQVLPVPGVHVRLNAVAILALDARHVQVKE